MRVFLLILLVLWMVVSTSATPVVQLTIRPQIMLARGDIHVVVHVPSDAKNRRLVIAWESADGGSTGETQRALDGDDAPTVHDLWLRSQVPAHYFFQAVVYGVDGKPRGSDTGKIITPDDGGW